MPPLPQHPGANGTASYHRYTSPGSHVQYPPPPPVQTLQSMEQRYTLAEKGKGRAADAAPFNINGHGHGSPTTADHAGRDPREKEAPRRAYTGTRAIYATPEEALRKKHNENRVQVPTRSQTPINMATPLPPKPLTAEDKAYFERVEVNKSKHLLSDMRYPCPVWSNTRKGLQNAVEYLRNPSRTGGASVDIGPGGMARGVILEGKAPTDLDMWTVQKHRSLLLPM